MNALTECPKARMAISNPSPVNTINNTRVQFCSLMSPIPIAMKSAACDGLMTQVKMKKNPVLMNRGH